MKQTRDYIEEFPDILEVRHKVTPFTEKKTFHLHKQLEILFSVSDNLICIHENSRIRIPKHSFVLLNTMSLHYIDSEAGSGFCNRYVITFSNEYIDDLSSSGLNLLSCFLNASGEAVILTPPEDEVAKILHILGELDHWTGEHLRGVRKPEYQAFLDNLAAKYQFGYLLTLINQCHYQHTSSGHPHRFQRYSALVFDICRYLEDHLQEDVSIDEIARIFSMSKTMLYNITLEVLNVSLSDYISTLRINKAKAYLSSTDYSVELISEKVGYSNMSSFSRFFKTNVGMSPLQYRKKTAHALSCISADSILK